MSKSFIRRTNRPLKRRNKKVSRRYHSAWYAGRIGDRKVTKPQASNVSQYQNKGIRCKYHHSCYKIRATHSSSFSEHNKSLKAPEAEATSVNEDIDVDLKFAYNHG